MRPGGFFRRSYRAFFLLPALCLTLSRAAPADPFTGASRSFDKAAPTATDLNSGDWGVAEQRGAATYTVPIVVPPGRNGMAPELALRYSSQSPLRGGLAAGWTLNLPIIEVDYSLGAGEATHYRASLGSASGRLVEVDDATPNPNATAYRLQFDESQTRFFHIRSGEVGPSYWLALTSDGGKHFFEDPSAGFSGYFPWHISRQVDSFGNTILYNWSLVPSPFDSNRMIDVSLTSIEYTSNPSARLAAHALVALDYAPLERCGSSTVPIGAAQRLGKNGVRGAQRLTNISTYVRDDPDASWRPSQKMQLTYRSQNSILTKYKGLEAVIVDDTPPPETEPGDTESGTIPEQSVTSGSIDQPQASLTSNQGLNCKQNPLRYLEKIDVTAFRADGESTSLPPITFTYNSRINTTSPINFGFPNQSPLDKTTVSTDTFGEFGDLRGARGSLLDVDGDGIRDRVSVIEENEKCFFTWHRGLPGGTFVDQVQTSPLPTFSWLYQTERFGFLNNVFEIQPFEACTLSGQVVQREVPGGLFEGRPTWKNETFVYGYNFVDYTGDGRLDFIITPFEEATRTSRLEDYPIDFPPPFRAHPDQNNDAPGNYLWLLYHNALEGPNGSIGVGGASVFSEQAFEVASPVPFPTFSNQEVEIGANPQTHFLPPPLFDIDGDGFLDALRLGKRLESRDCEFEVVDVAEEVEHNLWHWCVYLGHGGRTFEHAKVWYLPEDGVIGSEFSQTSLDINTNVFHQWQWTYAGLYDMDGDGLGDLVVKNDETNEVVMHRNTGSKFEEDATSLNFPQSDIEILQTDYWGDVRDGHSEDGVRGFRRRLVDLDQDGLLDLLFYENESGTDGNNIAQAHRVKAAFNAGGYFLEPVDLPDVWLWAKRLFSAKKGDWQLLTDFADVTGDGLADLAQWDGNSLTYISRPGLSAAPDLLSSVQNGRGLRINFAYAPSSSPDIVERTPQVAGAYILPNVSWVVTKTRINSGFDTPEMVTEYTYGYPIMRDASDVADQPEPSHFAGFARVTRTVVGEDALPAHRVTTAFSYQEDPEGREVSQWTYEMQNNVFRLDSYRETQWVIEKLFAGQAHVVHPASTLYRTCLPNGSDADCMAQTQNVYRVQEAWTGYAPSLRDAAPVACGAPQCDPAPLELFVRTELLEGDGVQPGASDRTTRYSYDIRYGQNGLPADDYRVRVRETVRELKTVDGIAQFGHSLVEFDEPSGLPEWTRVWRSSDERDYAQTNTEYDPATGNLLRTRKPMQRAADVWTEYTYDDYKLFVTWIKNGLSQTVYKTYDLATGVLVERRGPNFKTEAGEGTAVKFEEESWQIDGFGRVLEHAITIDDDQTFYKLYPIERFTYNDLEYQLSQENQGEPKPVTIQHEARLNFDDGPWITSEISLDGIGRVQSETQLLENGAVAKTTYGYDSLGNLHSVKVPDPSSNNLTNPDAQVTYTYAYDGLGRLTSFSDPNGNGMQVTHDGLVKTVQESNADGSGGPKQEVRDVFGRLVEVREIYPGVREIDPEVVATTTYTYDANDHLERITDAAGSVTGLTHNWTGNRTSVVRGNGGRTWQYEYDLNGNVVRKISPMPTVAAPENYTTTFLYDALDRIVEKRYSARTADSDPAGEVIKYYYDEGVNGIGRLSQVDLPFATIRYEYEARGLIDSEIRTFRLSDPMPMNVSQQVERNYNAVGQLTQSTWDDGQQWQIVYDRRGLVDSVEWYDLQADAWQRVADYARNLTGLPISRNSSYGQSRTYRYDVLGRPTGDTTTANGVTLATRSYTFSDSSDLLKVDGTTGDVSAAATYDYDAHHRLRTAAGPNGYRGAFSYSLAGNVLTAYIDWVDSPQSRSVRYEYGAVDPQAVDQLVNTEDGKAYASFEYEPSGNMTLRTGPDGEMVLHWDGLDQLRAVESPIGKETYYYDQDGSRMLAVNETGGVRFWFGERETHFGQDGIESLNYLHLSGGGPTLARVENGTNIELQYADALQNLMFSLDRVGNVKSSFLYGPFGEVVFETGGDEHRRQFNGKENDAATGLRYYGYRYYDPVTLRWNSADPLYNILPELGLNEPQRMNLYAFSLNNPVRYYDPDGREANDGDDVSCQQAGPEPDTCEVEPDKTTEQDEKVEKETKTETERKFVEGVADGLVERYGTNAASKAKQMKDLDLMSDEEFIALNQEIQRQLNVPPMIYDPKKPPPLTPIDKHNKEVSLMRREMAVSVGNSIGAIAAGSMRTFGVSRETSLSIGKVVGFVVDLGGFKGGAGTPHKLGQNRIEPVTTGSERQVGGAVYPPSLNR